MASPSGSMRDLYERSHLHPAEAMAALDAQQAERDERYRRPPGRLLTSQPHRGVIAVR